MITARNINSFDQAERFLFDHINLERIPRLSRNRNPFKLDRITAILQSLDNPHQQLRHIHIAGTKGKGSTVAMLTAALTQTGLTVGSFTSPHLIDIRERIRINNHFISQHDFTKEMRTVAQALQNDGFPDPPHFFEILTALAFNYFADNAVDIAIIETGLGGRLDCTNVIQPEVSVITQISYDHMNILGESLSEIALEKAGIFKPSVPALSAPQTEEVECILKQEAKRIGAPLQILGREIRFSSRFQSGHAIGPHTRITMHRGDSVFDDVIVPLPGIHQACNAGLALAVASVLQQNGFAIDTEQFVLGLNNTRIAGRMEYLPGNPPVLLDGAHNASSIKALIQAVTDHLNPESLVFIFACNTDKDITRMLKALTRSADKVIFTKVRDNPKSVSPEELKEQFTELGGHMSLTAETLTEALNIAARAVTSNDLIIITGSFFIVGEAKTLLENRINKNQQQNQTETHPPQSPVAQLHKYRRRNQ